MPNACGRCARPDGGGSPHLDQLLVDVVELSEQVRLDGDFLDGLGSKGQTRRRERQLSCSTQRRGCIRQTGDIMPTILKSTVATSRTFSRSAIAMIVAST
jgi:hypothetical protein